MNEIGGVPWKLTFSYGRALQAAALKAWGGKTRERRGRSARLHPPRPHELARGARQVERAAREGRLSDIMAEPLAGALTTEAFVMPLIRYCARVDRSVVYPLLQALAAPYISDARPASPNWRRIQCT